LHSLLTRSPVDSVFDLTLVLADVAEKALEAKQGADVCATNLWINFGAMFLLL
jgi:hypothetical protein